MPYAVHIVVCAGIVPDPLQTLEPISTAIAPGLKNEMVLPAVLDPWAASALYEAAAMAQNKPGSKLWLVSLGPKAKLQQVMMTIAQKVAFEFVPIDGPIGGFPDAHSTAAVLADTIAAHELYLPRESRIDEGTNAEEHVNQHQSGHGELRANRDPIRLEACGGGVTITDQSFNSAAQKAEEADCDVDVHEKLAPALAGADRQQAANAECKAEPCGNQRSGMYATGAQKTKQTQGNQ